MKSANLRQVTEPDKAMGKLSKRQKHALAIALWMEKKPIAQIIFLLAG
ncbi:hypothetical protein ACE1AT_29890 [Pelatocladus sp. BLCC-F211]